jgi:hypothetical protein
MKCKQTIAICIAFLVLLANSNTNFVLHFCGNSIAYVSLKVKSVSVTDTKVEDCCIVAEEQDDNGCCSDTKIKLEKKIDYQIDGLSFLSFITVGFPEFTTNIFSFLPSIPKRSQPEYFCDIHAPPKYKAFHQLIFYA